MSGAAADTTAVFPRERGPRVPIPATPTPDGMAFTPGLVGDPARGLKTFSAGLCIGCHTIKGNPMVGRVIGPEPDARRLPLHDRGGRSIRTTRSTCGSGSRTHASMKPGVLMPMLGHRQIDPQTNGTVVAAAAG